MYDAYKEAGGDADWCWENYLQVRSLKSAENVRKQLERALRKLKGSIPSTPPDHPKFSERIRRTLCHALFNQAAMVDESGKCYRTLQDAQYVLIHPSSCLKHKPEFVIYNELAVTEKSYMRCVTSVWPEWLLEANPAYFESHEWSEYVRTAFARAEKRAEAEKKRGKKT